MIGTIKKLFSGVLSFLFGLVGGKKSEKIAPSKPKAKKSKGYFMELNEDDDNLLANGTQAVKAELNKAADKTKEAVGDAVDKTKELVAAATKPVTSQLDKAKTEVASSKPASSVSQSAKSVSQSAKSKVESAKAKVESASPSKTNTNNQAAKTEATANNAAAKVELVQTAEGVKVEPAKQNKASVAKANTQTTTETTFAPKYLIPTNTNGRRRPGPNMSTFLDMARQVKTLG